jgi:hypothetical protein
MMVGLGLAGPVLAQTPAAPPVAEAKNSAPSSPLPAPSPALFGARVEAGDIGRVRAWLEAGLSPNFFADRIGSGLMIAAWNGDIPMMELFVAHGADIGMTNDFGEQALLHAAWRGHLDAAKWLLAHGAQAKRPPMQWTALHYAVFSGRKDLAQALIERGADIDARSPNGSSVLMMAVYEGREELATMLIDLGADRRAKNDWGDGALEWAMKFNHLKLARVVSSADEFAEAAARPKEHWGEAKKSLLASDELERMLRVRDYLEARRMSLDRIDRQLAAERARLAREMIAGEALPPRHVTLEVTARRGKPNEQKASLVRKPAGRRQPQP